MIVERRALGVEIVRADDGGVAPGVATADPAFFQDRHAPDTMLTREVIRRAEAVTASADNDYVVARLRLRATPLLAPAALAGQAALEERQGGEALHRSVSMPGRVFAHHHGGVNAAARARARRHA